VDEAYDYINTNLKHEWKEGKTEDQFLYSIRKKAIGPFKKQWWDMDPAVKDKIGQVLQEQFEFLFEKLEVKDTRDLIAQFTPIVEQPRPRPREAAFEGELEIASDLAD
jgi:hypothetical protein